MSAVEQNGLAAERILGELTSTLSELERRRERVAETAKRMAKMAATGAGLVAAGTVIAYLAYQATRPRRPGTWRLADPPRRGGGVMRMVATSLSTALLTTAATQLARSALRRPLLEGRPPRHLPTQPTAHA